MIAFKLKDNWLVCYTGISGKIVPYKKKNCITYIITNMKKSYKHKLPKELEVVLAGVRVENGELIVDVEFKKKFEPKDGDFLVSDSCSIFICSGIKGNYIGCHCALLCGGILTPVATNYVVREANIRFATEEEKKQIIDSLKKEGKRWNPETKQIEALRWRAEKGEYFYHIEFADKSIKVFQSSDNRGNHSSNLYARNNYFRTPEAAEKVADQIKEIFKNSKAE